MDQKQQISERIKTANNVLVTVSNNPSVDQLAACIGLTLALNKLGKHAAAVFSGQVPSTLEFLQPEKTLEHTTDSLRDFIISLDKSKADKLRYKVEDKVVKIFITPYRTSITEGDLEFSQGDLNVDLVIALGVHQQNELDAAITAHGRILHDATVSTINIKPGGEFGSINWLDDHASSLSEMAAGLAVSTDKQMMDGQIATAFLTGIVAETNRFSNEKTSPATMTISSELMAAGANQQLVATKLEPPAPTPPAPPKDEVSLSSPEPSPVPPPAEPATPAATPLTPAPKANDGTLEIGHDKPTEEVPIAEESTPKIHIDEHGSLLNLNDEKVDIPTPQEKPEIPPPPPPEPSPEPSPVPPPAEPAEKEMQEEPEKISTIDPVKHMGSSRMVLEPPSMAGTPLVPGAAATDDEKPSGAPMTLPRPMDDMPPPPAPPAGDPDGTLDFKPEVGPSAFSAPSPPPLDISAPPNDSAKNPFLSSSVPPVPPAPSAPPDLTPPSQDDPAQDDQARIDAARAAVEQAHSDAGGTPAGFNSLPLGEPLHEAPQAPPAPLNLPPPPPPPQPSEGDGGLIPPPEPTIIRPTEPPSNPPPPVPPPFTPGPSGL